MKNPEDRELVRGWLEEKKRRLFDSPPTESDILGQIQEFMVESREMLGLNEPAEDRAAVIQRVIEGCRRTLPPEQFARVEMFTALQASGGYSIADAVVGQIYADQMEMWLDANAD